ncbi:serine/threonine protein phosphatase [Rhizobium sp. B230/85]|uniref:metallophosphoesterase family protein n=1 Tax=unclassified Rhizobium TaxID=2613769 RepID=UPI001AD9E3C6|nr:MULTISPECIES: metallophosphoesterase family protein [unclassified Rhizobium]MBO9136774.1 serine/threonine protein phosphatase [Rhizobium sp. B209b/85]QXZ99081.1 serine/threonine protein phosphatase [Rhizobium sp. B230/85]
MFAFFKSLFESPETAEEQRGRPRLDAADFSAIYAVGDVHGCMGLLKEAYARIVADNEDQSGQKLVVFLGDYVDRGMSSRAVLDFLSRQSPEGLYHVCLCGNHDLEFLRFLRDPKNNMGWLNFGGLETLRSYGIDAEHTLKGGGGQSGLLRMVKEAVPDRHVRFLADLPSMLVVGKLVFAHAGIRPGVPLEKQTDEDLMWIREPFLARGPEMPFVVVHGHTVCSEPSFSSGRVGIDTGAYSTGRLTVLKIRRGKAKTLR